jgi:hypothetical protein
MPVCARTHLLTTLLCPAPSPPPSPSRLPPRPPSSLHPSPHHIMVPAPGLRVDGLPHTAQDAQRVAQVLLDVQVPRAHQAADGGGRGVELAHLCVGQGGWGGRECVRVGERVAGRKCVKMGGWVGDE